MKAQSFQVRSLKHQIAACLKLIAAKVKSAVLKLIDLESRLEEAMSEQLQIQYNGQMFAVPKAPGIYKVEDSRIAWGGAFHVAYDGEKALFLAGSAPKTNDLSRLDWRMGKLVENNFVKLGR